MAESNAAVLEAPNTPHQEALSPRVHRHEAKAAGPMESAMATTIAKGDTSNPDRTLAELAGVVGREKPEAINNSREAARKAIETKQQDPEQSKHLVALNRQEQTEHAEYLHSLRDPNVVGKDKYGKGVVNSCHHKGESTHDAEDAQTHASEQYETKIDAGLVDPSMIATEMNNVLQVEGEIIDPPTSHEQVVPKMTQELQGFVDKGLITQQEGDVIKGEADTFAKLYREGYQDADPAKVYEVTRDMTRIIAYQTRMDKNVLVGSDHGERHILRGNMKFADQIITSLGDSVSAKDKVLAHAIIAMHDVGYTTGAAQSKDGFEAAKDHPVAGAAFIEANKEWVKSMFGENAVGNIKEAILDHSYVGGDFEAPRPEGSDINPRLIRGITSAVDSLGVTAETKIPSFFNNPDTIGELFKIRLAGRMNGRDKDGNFPSEEQRTRHDTIVGKRKDRLREIAKLAPTEEQQRAFGTAVESVNLRTADILGQFTGEVTGVRMVRHENNGRLVPLIDMAMLGKRGTQMRDMFGGEAELMQFVKGMEDLGITGDQIAKFHSVVEASHREGTIPSSEVLSYSSEKAVVHFGFKEEKPSDEFAEMEGVFNEAAAVTQKWKTLSILERADAGAEDFQTQMTDVVGALGLLIGSPQGETLGVLYGEGGFLQRVQSEDINVRTGSIQQLKDVLRQDVDKYLLE